MVIIRGVAMHSTDLSCTSSHLWLPESLIPALDSEFNIDLSFASEVLDMSSSADEGKTPPNSPQLFVQR